MSFHSVFKAALVISLLATLSGCGNSGLFGGGRPAPVADDSTGAAPKAQYSHPEDQVGATTIWDIFKPNNSGTNVKVNRYIWNASLEVLNFLPIQSVDPFTGIIVTGYGTPPGGGRAYRATVYIKDPALDARSLNVAMQSRGGRPVSVGTQRAVEDAILARARQLRIADGKL